MRREAHAEHERYLRHRALATQCRVAVARWRRSGVAVHGPDGNLWTPARALALVEEMVTLLRAYNRVLWEQFPYCRRCRGGCCVVGASRVTAFDAMALALLDENVPERPARLPLAEGDCIYLTPQGCSWPQAWRPLKCATFYCLGSGDWTVDAGDARYREVTQALAATVTSYLPGVLATYEAETGAPLLETLFDPLAFAAQVGEALYAAFVAPFLAHYPEAAALAEEPASETTPEEATLTFIAEMAAAVFHEPSPPPGSGLTTGQLLADLELLEWAVLGGADGALAILERLVGRYKTAPAPAATEAPSPWYRMRRHAAALLEERTNAGQGANHDRG